MKSVCLMSVQDYYKYVPVRTSTYQYVLVLPELCTFLKFNVIPSYLL